MNSAELSCILERALYESDCKFLGVFAADRIPQHITSFPCCLVANTDPANKPGEHWVAYYCATPSNVEFFYSYGLSWKSHKHLCFPIVPTKVNRVCFQSPLAVACGHYCIYFLCNRAFGRTMCGIVLLFKRARRTFNHPDQLVRYFVRRIVARLHVVRRCLRSCRGMQCCRTRRLK